MIFINFFYIDMNFDEFAKVNVDLNEFDYKWLTTFF